MDDISQFDDYFVTLYHPVTTDIDVNKIAMQTY